MTGVGRTPWGSRVLAAQLLETRQRPIVILQLEQLVAEVSAVAVVAQPQKDGLELAAVGERAIPARDCEGCARADGDVAQTLGARVRSQREHRRDGRDVLRRTLDSIHAGAAVVVQ